jgi:hypothetical protein
MKRDDINEMETWFQREMDKAGFNSSSRKTANRGGAETVLDALAGVFGGQDGSRQTDDYSRPAGYPDEKTYAELIEKIRGETSHRKMESDLTGVRRNVNDVLDKKKRTLGKREQVSSYVEYLAGEDPSSESRRASASDKPRVRPCACGCGSLVMDGVDEIEGEIKSFCARPLNADQATSQPAVDSRSQRAACERLHQRKTKEHNDKQLESECRHLAARRHVDLERLHFMARPKEEPTIDVEAHRRAEALRDQTTSVSRSKSTPGPRWPPREHKPLQQLPHSRSTASAPSASLVSAGLDALAGTGMRFAAPIPKRQIQALGGGRVQQLRRDDKMPGLSQLLGRVDMPAQGCEATRMPAELLGDAEAKKFRSVTSQKEYTKTRLYHKTPFRPGSVEELQAKLDSLRSERHARETAAAVAAVS